MLHAGNSSLVKPPLVTNDISNILKNKGLLFAKHEKHKVWEELLSPAFSRARIGGLLKFWSKGWKLSRKWRRWCMFPGAAPVVVVVEMGRWCSFTMLALPASAMNSVRWRVLL